MVLAGYGAIRAGAQPELLALVERYQIPFASTMDGKGVLPENHPLSLGVFGTAGDPGANEWFKASTFVIAVGNSFAHNATFRFKEDLYAGKKLMHINIDRNEINKVYEADYGMISDAKLALQAILSELTPLAGPLPPRHLTPDKWHDAPIQYSGKKIHPGELAKHISECIPPNTIVLGEAGGDMLWLNCYMQLKDGQVYQNPGSFGPMAVHVNGSLGVKCSNPDKTVVAAVGDGAYLMAGFELLTAVQYDIPVVWVIFNNGEFNIIKGFLLQLFGEAPFMTFNNPDYVMYAKACGATGFRVESLDEFDRVFAQALAMNKPVIIDVPVENEVYAPFSMGGI